MSQDDINAAHKDRMAKLKAAQDRMVAAKTVSKGLVIVHTGAGKGKTTAALGMACRCIGHHMKVSVIQFIKGSMPTGESVVFEAFRHLAEFRATGGAAAATLVRVVLQCYYRDDRVLRSLGLELRAPFPKGYVLPDGDWSLLDPVKARGGTLRRAP